MYLISRLQVVLLNDKPGNSELKNAIISDCINAILFNNNSLAFDCPFSVDAKSGMLIVGIVPVLIKLAIRSKLSLIES